MSVPLNAPVLVLDIGGSKTLVALVDGSSVLDEERVPTAPGAGADAWIEAAVAAAAPWAGRYGAVAAAVTGVVAEGRWSALNSGTLAIAENFPLTGSLERRFGCPAFAVNDAQAAAWGEHSFGAGQGSDMVFLTISTGIGGGIVLNGRLMTGRGGLAGHVGVTGMVLNDDPRPVEDHIAGRWIAAEASRAGRALDAEGVFAAAAAGEGWAEGIVATSAARAARLLCNVQLVLAPERIVIGGGIGLAHGYLDRLRAFLDPLPPVKRPQLVAAALGSHAGIIGAAALTQAEARTGANKTAQQRRLA